MSYCTYLFPSHCFSSILLPAWAHYSGTFFLHLGLTKHQDSTEVPEYIPAVPIHCKTGTERKRSVCAGCVSTKYWWLLVYISELIVLLNPPVLPESEKTQARVKGRYLDGATGKDLDIQSLGTMEGTSTDNIASIPGRKGIALVF